MSSTSYDPYSREEDAEEQRQRAAREEHEHWSLEQSRAGRSAMMRENTPTMALLKEEP